MWCVRVYTLRLRWKRNNGVAQASYDSQQVKQRAAKAVELSHHQCAVMLREVEACLAARVVIVRARRLEQVTDFDTGRAQGSVLQRYALLANIRQDVHVTDLVSG